MMHMISAQHYHGPVQWINESRWWSYGSLLHVPSYATSNVKVSFYGKQLFISDKHLFVGQLSVGCLVAFRSTVG